MKRTVCDRIHEAKQDTAKRRVGTQISILVSATDVELSAIAELMRQLRTDGQPANIEEVRAVVAAREARVIVARDRRGKILGTTTLYAFRTHHGVKTRVEDVVVDIAARRRGIAEKLQRTALTIARALNAVSIELTSNPAREAANALYIKLGYELYETNVYVRKP